MENEKVSRKFTFRWLTVYIRLIPKPRCVTTKPAAATNGKSHEDELSALPRACNQFPWWITPSVRDTWKPYMWKKTQQHWKRTIDFRSSALICRHFSISNYRIGAMTSSRETRITDNRESNSWTTSIEQRDIYASHKRCNRCMNLPVSGDANGWELKQASRINRCILLDINERVTNISSKILFLITVLSFSRISSPSSRSFYHFCTSYDERTSLWLNAPNVNIESLFRLSPIIIHVFTLPSTLAKYHRTI